MHFEYVDCYFDYFYLYVDLFDLSRSRSAAALNIIITSFGPREVDNSTNEKDSRDQGTVD